MHTHQLSDKTGDQQDLGGGRGGRPHSANLVSKRVVGRPDSAPSRSATNVAILGKAAKADVASGLKLHAWRLSRDPLRKRDF